MKRFGRWLVWAIVILLLLGVAAGLGRLAGHRPGHFSGTPGVAVIRLEEKIFAIRGVLEQIHAATIDPRVKAVVLRVDSPGGSVGASQELYLTLKALRAKKPLVASFGTVAASGGYYAGVTANPVFTLPGTVTGSIGVRMMHVDFSDLLRWALVKPQTLKSGAMKDVGDVIRAMTPAERTYLENILHTMHRQFIHDVAESRGMTEDVLTPLADGRVFTGEEAVTLKLADRIGTLYDAIAEADRQAGVPEDADLMDYDDGKGWFDHIGRAAVQNMMSWMGGVIGASNEDAVPVALTDF